MILNTESTEEKHLPFFVDSPDFAAGSADFNFSDDPDCSFTGIFALLEDEGFIFFNKLEKDVFLVSSTLAFLVEGESDELDESSSRFAPCLLPAES